MAFSRILAWVLKRFRTATLAFLIGLVLGSFWVLWPFKDFAAGATVTGRSGEAKTGVRIATAPNQMPKSGGEAGGCGALFALGLVAALGVEQVGRRKKSDSSRKSDTK
ncbi:MAG: hypothetical protein CSA75_00725 [Sorangium cellulosum]|nr:MAG: hypothetical protein CSA75_00725 [Sorangium cellulosum]